MKKFFWIFLLILSVSSSLFLTSCKDDDDDDDDVIKAKVMVVHASPGAPDVDILVDDTKVNTAPLAYPNNTAYLDVTAGVRNVKVNVAGLTPVVNVLDFSTPTLVAGSSYSVFAGNTVADIEPIVFTDNLSAPEQGKAHVRFIHLSPDAPAVDIALVGGAVVFPNFSFKEASTFTPLNAGTYNLEVRVAGTATVALTLPPVTFVSGKIYTVFAKGLLAGTGEQALGAQVIANN